MSPLLGSIPECSHYKCLRVSSYKELVGFYVCIYIYIYIYKLPNSVLSSTPHTTYLIRKHQDILLEFALSTYMVFIFDSLCVFINKLNSCGK